MLRSKLHGKAYHADLAPVWTREIADEIKHQLKEKKYPRYKYAVQVVIGEQKGEGVKCVARPRSAAVAALRRTVSRWFSARDVKFTALAPLGPRPQDGLPVFLGRKHRRLRGGDVFKRARAALCLEEGGGKRN